MIITLITQTDGSKILSAADDKTIKVCINEKLRTHLGSHTSWGVYFEPTSIVGQVLYNTSNGNLYVFIIKEW